MSGDQPGWPTPAKPIPYHEPGHPSKATQYTTEAQIVNAEGQTETIQLSGLDAMVADGQDPLQANYTLGSLDKIVRGGQIPSGYGTQVLSVTGEGDNRTISQLGSDYPSGVNSAIDVAAGDLNGDAIAEQVVLWLDSSNNVKMTTGEGATGKASSAPAAAANGANIDLLVRGYDSALWRCLYDTAAKSCAWDQASTGGLLLSAPTMVSKGAGTFDAYAVLSDGNLSNQIYRRNFQSSNWSGDWEVVGEDSSYWQPLTSAIPTPELPAPAVVEVGGVVYVFRNDADHLLSWWRSDAPTWESLENPSFPMADYAPAALSTDSDSLFLLSISVGGNVMIRKYTISTGQWGNWALMRDLRKNVQGLEDIIADSAPLAIFANGEISVYVRGSDQQLWAAQCSSSPAQRSACGAWAALGGELASSLGGAAVEGQSTLFSLTQTGLLQSYQETQGWQEMPAGITPCCQTSDLGAGVRKNIEHYTDYSVDVETGYFLGNGRSQIVAGYFSSATPNGITLALYDISDSKAVSGFTPEQIASTLVGNDYASHFRIAVGDFLDGDGIDDIAVVHFHTDQLYYSIHFYRVNPSTHELVFVKMQQEAPVLASNYLFTGVLDTAAGDFDKDGRAELALITGWGIDNFDSYGWCEELAISFYTYVFDIASDYTVTKKAAGDRFSMDASTDASKYSIQFSIAAGDVNGDGKDELARTWPNHFDTSNYHCEIIPWERNYNNGSKFYRRAQVISFDASLSPSIYNLPNALHGPTYNSYADRMVMGDFDLDLKDEILWQAATNSDMQLYVYEERTEESQTQPGEYVENYYQIGSMSDSWHWLSSLVSADFTGESLRVGPPSHRVQSGVVTPVVLLNMPPKHRDIVNGTVLDIGAANQSSYTSTTTQENVSTVESTRDWSLSVGMEAGASVFGASATTSLKNTYWGEFLNRHNHD